MRRYLMEVGGLSTIPTPSAFSGAFYIGPFSRPIRRAGRIIDGVRVPNPPILTHAESRRFDHIARIMDLSTYANIAHLIGFELRRRARLLGYIELGGTPRSLEISSLEPY